MNESAPVTLEYIRGIDYHVIGEDPPHQPEIVPQSGWTKTKIAFALAIGLSIAAGPTLYEMSQDSNAPSVTYQP